MRTLLQSPLLAAPHALLGVLAFCHGCSGGAQIELTSLDYRAIDPPAPRATRFSLDRCYWWKDESGHVWVAMERDVDSWLVPAGRLLFQLSLELERAPAGKARNYLVAEKELRAVARVGPIESRFISVSGIVALYKPEKERLRGSFRLLVSRETSQLLGGWSRPASYLFQGSFEAVHDEQQGREVARATESAGWDRAPRPVDSRTAIGALDP